MQYFLILGCSSGLVLVVVNVWYWRDFSRTELQNRVDETTESEQGRLRWSANADSP